MSNLVSRNALSLAGLVACVSLDAADPLSLLSDEFSDVATFSQWKRINVEEGWNADQLETVDVGESQEGHLTLVPYSSSWYQDWRGVLIFKEVTGDFVATMEVESRNREGTGAPNSSYSLAGIMARAPRPEISEPSDWTPGGENYVFLSLGTGNQPGNYQFEVKTTTNGRSSLQIDSGAPSAVIQVARVGDVFLILRKLEGGEWEVHRRYSRPDLPDTLQVGITVYTDWSTVEGMDPFQHNQTVVTEGNPDLKATIDYFRFIHPFVPPALANADLSNPNEASDPAVIAFLGDRTNLTFEEANRPPELYVDGLDDESGLTVGASLQPGCTYRLEAKSDQMDWSLVETIYATDYEWERSVPKNQLQKSYLLRLEELPPR